MKKRKLDDLLKKMASHSSFEKEENSRIVNLDDELSQMIMGGYYKSTNDVCSGNNSSCQNQTCSGSNQTCSNHSCEMPNEKSIISLSV